MVKSNRDNGVNNKGSVVISRNGDLVCGGHVKCVIGGNNLIILWNMVEAILLKILK